MLQLPKKSHNPLTNASTKGSLDVASTLQYVLRRTRAVSGGQPNWFNLEIELSGSQGDQSGFQLKKLRIDID